MLIKVNGEEREVPDGTTVEELVRVLALAPERLAVELNRDVVRRDEWPARALVEGDRVEIVHFVGGGESQKIKGTPQRHRDTVKNLEV